ncbi:MAG: NADH:ubiquinone reductase (Na(+)-transporting) subunit C [Candidatus Marinimicrobia bacterium]|nr:NADH:ubiquinone reductase (Na(+)-transporting) subunit C [Candidatus Neomarinimicrobiota bacterium]
MPKKTNPFIFIGILTVTSSLLLSLAATQLKSYQDYNVDVDKKKNVLKCIGVDVLVLSSESILSEYNSRISEIITDLDGNNIESVKFSDLQFSENKMTGESIYSYDGNNYLPIFKSSSPEATIIPISGKGLWSTLFGYFAVDNDFNTVRGITFYQHSETPGLGGEVDKGWFQNNFVGKKIKNDDGDLVSVKVVKGKSGDDIHGVDGISGATITSRGLTNFLFRDLTKYTPFFNKQLDRIN